MKIRYLLPVGSIVLLKNGEKKLIVVGIMQSNADENGQEYDYLGFLYPEGHIGNQFQYLFNHEDIKDVIFRGFEDDERLSFLVRLEKLYES